MLVGSRMRQMRAHLAQSSDACATMYIVQDASVTKLASFDNNLEEKEEQQEQEEAQ